MNPEQTLYEWIDLYAKNKLSDEDVAALEEKMRIDADFKKQVEQHIKFVEAIQFYDERNTLKHKLDTVHQEMLEETKVVPLKQTRSSWKKYWPMTAVAASVALISILGTLFMTRDLETKQTAYYKELRRNVDQIRKSQSMMMKDIAATKEKGKILPGNYAGTGFLISANGYIATSHHVVKDADSIYIENNAFGSLKVSVVNSDPANDVSILKIDSLVINGGLPFIISRTEASLAEDVYTLGFPREDVVFGEGSVSALSGYKQNPNAYQISVPVNPGNSGGPLLNNKGDLIGMISGIQTETLGAAFAIKSTKLLEIIDNIEVDSVSTPLTLPKQNALKNNTRVQQVKQWKDYVFVVRVYKN